jgi:SNF2 family DNA or RNA helicase
MQILDNKALMFVTRKADQITALIPKSKVLATNGDKAKIVVNWGLDEWQLLKNLGIKDPPHPILGRYHWPGVYTPFDHQRATAEFLVSNPRCFCFSEPGTGKTSAAAWAADYLMSKGRVKRVLVVCPVSIMETAWRADLFRTVMHRTAGIATGTRQQREKIINGDYEFVIINFDGVKVVTDALTNAKFDLIIVDEASQVKSTSTDRWKSLSSLVLPSTRVWAMTGTPAAQSPMDAYGLAKLIAPASVPRFAGAWRDKVMTKLTQYKWVPRPDAQDIVHAALQPAIRFTKEECLDLPDQLTVTREVPLTAQQQKYYDTIKKQMVALAAGEEITAANAAGMLNKLLQISQASVYTDTREVVEFDMSTRLNELMDIITSTRHKVLVFVPFRHVLERLEIELNNRRVALIGADPNSYEIEHIHGGVPASQRADIIKRFQTEDRVKVLLLIPQATAHGITLTRADQVVWWGPIPSTETYLQANARAHRAGQTNKVTVTHLQGSPVEKRVYSMLQNKVDMHRELVELYRQEIA